MERTGEHDSPHQQRPDGSNATSQDRHQPDVLARLEQAIGEIHDSDSFRRYLDVQSRFHRYSWRNVALILSQRPDATQVAGYNAWLKLHRYVRRGEHGIKIIVPMSKKAVTEQEEDQRVFFGTGRPLVFDLGQHPRGKHCRSSRCRTYQESREAISINAWVGWRSTSA